MQKIQTSRFGEIEVDEQRVIHFQDGILGFPKQKAYVIIENTKKSPFCWLQSMDVPELAFVLTNPFSFVKDYLQSLSPEELSFIQGDEKKDLVLFSLVTVPAGHPEQATMNLLGPLVIDMKTKTGRQVILPNSGYSHRHPIFTSPSS
jgi:flagellar assembly factor FliW